MSGRRPSAAVHVPRPPEPEALVRWRHDFGRRFVIFVDVEEEFDWSRPFSREARAVTNVAALPAFHAKLAGRGIAMTYLVDHPVATDPAAIAALRPLLATPGTEIGSQLHPWVNPPYDEELSARNSFVGNLPPALETAKLVTLTDAIAAAFGRSPRVFRAGRYGIGPGTLTALARLGYRIDTSMRSRFRYSDEGGPDFGRIGNAAFDAGGLIEIPLTTIFTGWGRRIGPSLHRAASWLPHGPGLLAYAGLVSRVPLTPEGTHAQEACEAIRVAAGEGTRLLVLSFHSPSLVPGHTPYVSDTATLAQFHDWWDVVLDALVAADYRPASVADLLAAA